MKDIRFKMEFNFLSHDNYLLISQPCEATEVRFAGTCPEQSREAHRSVLAASYTDARSQVFTDAKSSPILSTACYHKRRSTREASVIGANEFKMLERCLLKFGLHRYMLLQENRTVQFARVLFCRTCTASCAASRAEAFSPPAKRTTVAQEA